MEGIKNGTIDFLKSTVIGICVGAIIGVIFIIIGLIAYKGNLINALYVGRCALLLIGSLCMVLSAGMFLKRDALRPLKDKEGWKRIFKVLNPGYILVSFSIGVVLVGSVVDLVIYNIK